jgi:hypothetical protein
MKEKEIEKFEKVQTQLDALYAELSSLSKKAADEPVNKFKLRFINQVISEANSIMKNRYKPFDDFSSFNEDDLPTNSDVTLMISQYLNCMEELRVANIEQSEYGEWYWLVNGKESSIQTPPPKKLRRNK